MEVEVQIDLNKEQKETWKTRVGFVLLGVSIALIFFSVTIMTTKFVAKTLVGG